MCLCPAQRNRLTCSYSCDMVITMKTEANNSKAIPSGISPMEFFILASIDRAGADSLYALNQRAGLQPGSIRPALNRLQKKALLHRTAAGARGRRQFRLSAAGKQFLEANWRNVLQDHSDIESILRSACVADLMREPSMATDYLRSMAARRFSDLDRKEPYWPTYSQDINPLSTYKFTKSIWEGHRFGAEASAFSTMVKMREGQQPSSTEEVG